MTTTVITPSATTVTTSNPKPVRIELECETVISGTLLGEINSPVNGRVLVVQDARRGLYHVPASMIERLT